MGSMTVNSKLERVWQDPAVIISMYYPRIYPEELRKTMKILNDFAWSACWDSNLGYPAAIQEIPAAKTWSMILCTFLFGYRRVVMTSTEPGTPS